MIYKEPPTPVLITNVDAKKFAVTKSKLLKNLGRINGLLFLRYVEAKVIYKKGANFIK